MRVECPDYDVDPAIDKGIIYQEGVCPSTDPRLLWDYTNGILNVDGKIAASGSIATSNDLEGSMLASLALGTGSFNFTPPAGYGGLVYRGGSIWYYWDNSLNMWETLDFSTHVQNTVSIIAGSGLVGGGPLTGNVTLAVDPNYGFVDVYHNNVFVSNRPIINFQDSVSVSWGISTNGNVAVTAFGTGGGAWLANVNANNFSINNLNSINGIPVSLFCTNPFNRDVIGNNYNLSQINNLGSTNLSVSGQITYQGLPIEDFFAAGGLWTANPDGSIFRDSNVFITGSNTPLTITSTTASNFLYLNTPATTGAWNAIGIEFAGVYYGEIGWGQTSLELWTRNSLILRGIDAGNILYTPGPVGVGIQNPQFPIDVVGGINDTTCYYIHGRSFACWDGSGGILLGGTQITASTLITSPVYQVGGVTFALGDGGSGVNLTNITNLNGMSPSSFSQTPWAQNINGNGFQLAGASLVGATQLQAGTGGIQAAGNINTASCYQINSVPWACAVSGGAQIALTNVATINGTPPGTGSGGSYNGPTQGPDPSGPRQLNINFQNNTGRPIWVSVSVEFPQGTGGSVAAYLGYSSPASDLAGYVDTGSGVTGGTWQVNFVVMPGMWYQVFDNSGQVSIFRWAEWW